MILCIDVPRTHVQPTHTCVGHIYIFRYLIYSLHIYFIIILLHVFGMKTGARVRIQSVLRLRPLGNQSSGVGNININPFQKLIYLYNNNWVVVCVCECAENDFTFNYIPPSRCIGVCVCVMPCLYALPNMLFN